MFITVALIILCFSSVHSDSSMSMSMAQDMAADKMSMVDTAMSKEKRYLNHHLDGLPCPSIYPNIHSSSIVLKPPSKTIVSPINYHMPTYHHQPAHQQLWQPMQHQFWQPMQHQTWQPKIIVQKPVFPYAPMYHQPSIQPHYSHNIVKFQQPIYQKPLVLLKPCVPMPCKPITSSYQYPKSEIKYVQPEHQVSYIKVPQPQPIVHHPMPLYLPSPAPVHVHKLSHVKEICAK